MNWTRLQSEFYEKHAATYDSDRDGSDRAYARKARQVVELLPGAGNGVDVLEVGAGSGLVTVHALERSKARRWIALDLSESMLERARTRCGDSPRLELRAGDACALPLADGAVDAVVGVDILHHLDDPARALADWRRVTRVGGVLAVLETSALNPLTLKFWNVEHEKRVFLNTPWNLAKWARSAGWRNVVVRPAAAFTPSGPRALAAPLDALDAALVRVPGVAWITALFAVTGVR